MSVCFVRVLQRTTLFLTYLYFLRILLILFILYAFSIKIITIQVLKNHTLVILDNPM